MASTLTNHLREHEILSECYRQFKDHCKCNNYQFNIKLSQTFQGPIKLTNIKNKGRCFIATKPIKCGESLLIEKAFVFSSRQHHSFYKLNNQFHDGLEFDETALLMAQLIEDKIMSSNEGLPQTEKKLKYLHPRMNEMDNFEEFDCAEFGIEEAHDLYLFNHSLSQLSKDDVFTKRLPHIIYSNAMVVTQHTEQLCYFKPINHGQGTNADDDDEKNEYKSKCCSFMDMIGDGIYLKGSFFNHDCCPNLNRYFIGDVLVVKAVKDIKVGEECTFSYLETEYLCESETFRARRLPFECNCNKCIRERPENESDDEEESDEEEEDVEEEESDDDILVFNDVQCSWLFEQDPPKRIELIDKLMKMNVLRHSDLISGYTAKAMANLELKQYGQASDSWMKCVECIGNAFGDIHEHMVPFYLQSILCQIALLCRKEKDLIDVVKESDEIMRMIKTMINIHDVCFGGGCLFFLQRYTMELSLSTYPNECRSINLWRSLLTHCHRYVDAMAIPRNQPLNPNKARVTNADIEWTKYISDRHELARILNHEARALLNLKQDPPTYAVSIYVKSHKVSSINPTNLQNPYRIAGELLRLMKVWNEAIRPAQGRYDHIRRAVGHLLQFAQNEDTSLSKLQTIYDALCYLFVDRKDASFFYRTLYYSQFPYFITNGRLLFVERIGGGAQADVIKVKHHKNASQIYALKIFNKGEDKKFCLREERIMRKIRDGVSKSDKINTPKLIGSYCHAQSILMEYVNGDPLDTVQGKWTEFEVDKLLNEVRFIIVRLGQIGIGHFDLNEGNILKHRISGQYYLIDFGFAVSFSLPFEAKPTSTLAMDGIIGTLLYLSPQTITLNMMLRALNKRDLDIKKLIIEANLYSLQAIALNSILLRNDRQRQLELTGYQNNLTDEWHSTGDVLSAQILRYLCDLWKLNQAGVALYFEQRDHGMVLTKEMFSKLDGNFRYVTLKHENSRCAIVNYY